ncbi:MAG: GAF domain-containing sensor histidine kinase [Planctomycetota bacterium]|jgi:signal transduction histidine kinase
MARRFFSPFQRPKESDSLLTEFGESLLLIVDPEQLRNNLLSKLREIISVEKAFVYLASQSESPRLFHLVGPTEAQQHLPDFAVKDKIVSWFRTNRQILFFSENREVSEYLAQELEPFLRLSINLAFPLVSMDRLIGIVFLYLPEGPLSRDEAAKIQTLGRQAGLAFENALLFKERLRQNERMFRAEQLATMGQFAAGIAHELRNPLTSIRSTVQYLSGEFEQDGQAKKLAENVLSEVDRLNGIVENLLNLAKPTESKPQELDVRKEIEHYLHFVEAQAKKQNVQIQTQIEKDLPKLFCDPAELRQVLINLVLNGMQAMPDGGPILIKASEFSPKDRAYASEKKKILIEVEDKGIGIPPDLSEKVFEPFFTTKPGGTGLGLTICNNIIRRYGGEIWIAQSAEGGTVVKVTLPSV